MRKNGLIDAEYLKYVYNIINHNIIIIHDLYDINLYVVHHK